MSIFTKFGNAVASVANTADAVKAKANDRLPEIAETFNAQVPDGVKVASPEVKIDVATAIDLGVTLPIVSTVKGAAWAAGQIVKGGHNFAEGIKTAKIAYNDARIQSMVDAIEEGEDA